MPADDTLCGWGNEAKVEYFLANADIIVPRRAEQMKLLVELLPDINGGNISVLDLGAGFGAVTEQILAHYPRAKVTCVDGSEAMVRHAAERMRKYGERVKILKSDLADRSWWRVLKPFTPISAPTNKVGGDTFDAIVSAIAIHHLSNERKRELYRELLEVLAPNGIFLNNDVVATPPALKARFERLNLASIQDQERPQRRIVRPLDQIEAEMREQLRMAGERHQSHIAPL
ncbi:MAG: class I SAM-dependent methyltransferase, partial [Deltaproteobacteria bacterium]|nr:class I SAM-dependent methyltransferase [Deltaproteobacteria bacterium]